MERIGDLHARLSREELTEGIRALRARIRRYRTEYDATDPGDLVLRVESADSPEWAAVGEWRALDNDLRVAQATLALYDFMPDDDRGSEGDDGSGSQGALAHRNDFEAGT
jgi:hypothetical protein